MKFMTMVTSSLNSQGKFPPPALMDAIFAFGKEAQDAGVLVQQGGLLPIANGAVFDLREGALTLTDGPFAEAKEWVGGYAVYEVADKETALDWARRFVELHQKHWPEWEGQVEIRQIM